MRVTKKQVEAIFREDILPEIRKRYEKDGRIDHPARREEWNNYTDSLCKDGKITLHQYETWSNPY